MRPHRAKAESDSMIDLSILKRSCGLARNCPWFQRVKPRFKKLSVSFSCRAMAAVHKMYYN